MQKRLPIGIENFERIIEDHYYYVDKTNLVKDILDKGSLVTLFTRPRRFGKTLNMSMLRYFFEMPIDGHSCKHLFDGLKIANAGELYTAQQEQYPVISLTLKSAKQPTFELAYDCMIDEIAKEFYRHNYVYESDVLNEEYRDRFLKLRQSRASQSEYAKALGFLSDCLCQYHKQQVIILIDEYDVPLENAYFAGFYEEMIAFIRSLFESALKTNDNLKFAVITGCLRISKESIFTGLNNLKVVSILDKTFGEQFGFTQTEVEKLLHDFDREERMSDVKKWYDGYVFGETEIYNPWSVINFVDKLVTDADGFPTSAWANSSSNSIIKDLVYRASEEVKSEIQDLIDGKTIRKQIHEDITYADIYSSEDNLWNFLYFTGYLKAISIEFEADERYVRLAIPNIEVKNIYKNQIQNWFRDEIKASDLSGLYAALINADEKELQRQVQTLLMSTISYMDHAETFYHGFLLGILSNIVGYRTKSNREAGNGRFDIAVISNDIAKRPIILELKVAAKFRELEGAAEKGLQQIRDRQYAISFAEDGYREVICYGIGFYKKQVRIKAEIINIEEYI